MLHENAHFASKVHTVLLQENEVITRLTHEGHRQQYCQENTEGQVGTP